MSIIKLGPKFLKYFFVILGITMCIASTANARGYTFTTIEPPCVSPARAAFGINNLNDIVGFSGEHGFLDIGGTFTWIDFPRASQTNPYGINDLNSIAGTYRDANSDAHGFLYDGGSFTPINFPAASETYAAGINNSGVIVGYYRAPTGSQGFIYGGGIFTSIAYPGASQTMPFGINNSGSISGYYPDATGYTHGFLWVGGTFSSIDFPGASDTCAFGINDSGDIVGWYALDGIYVAHGFLYSGGSFTTIDFPGALHTYAAGINNSGAIVGYYVDATGPHGFLASPWTISTIDSAGDVGPDTSIAIDSNNKVHISYVDNINADLRYATNASGPWVVSTIDSEGAVGIYSSIAIDSNNKVHISYYDVSNGDLKYATNALGSWETFTVDSTGDVGRYTSIAVDSNNKIHISYCDFTNFDLKHATNASGSWETSTIDSTGNMGRYTSIAIDSNNKIHISYGDYSNWNLKYATNASGLWTTSIVDSSIGFGISMAVDSNNKVHVSYPGPLFGPLSLKYATNASGSWVTSTIESGGMVGDYSSIAIDSYDKIHISYFDNTNADLKYTTNAYGSWLTSTLDSAGIVGGFTSIAVDSNDKVHISHYDGTNGDLKYATNATPCTLPVITTQPQSQTIQRGQTASMSVSASGTPPLSYQWYQGSSGDTSSPITGAIADGYTTPPLTQTTSYWVRVANFCGSAASNTATVTVAIAGISVVSPNSGETLTAGSMQTIRWNYTGNPGPYVKVELLKGGVVNRTIKSFVWKGTGGSGSFNWTIPPNQTPGTDYRIRLSSTTYGGCTDTSDSDFTIAAPKITVVSPNSGETWTAGSTQTIRWTYTGNPGLYVKIELLKGGVAHRIIRSFVWKGAGGSGSFKWRVPANQAAGTEYSIRVTSTINNSYSDTSDSNFAISKQISKH